MHQVLHGLLTAFLAALLLWVPLPFGSVVPWAVALLRVAGFAALALAGHALRRGRVLAPVAGPAGSLAGLALLGFLQSLPWPHSLVAGLSPSHRELFRAGGDLLGQPVAAAATPLSLAPSVSRATALTFAALAAFVAAAAVAGRRRGSRRVLGAAVLLAVLCQVLLGAPRWWARARELWGLAVPGDATRLRGTFVNPNHLATYLAIGLAIAFAAAWWALAAARRARRVELRLALVGPPVLLWLAFFVALAFSGSRAGLAAALAGAAVQTLLVAGVERSWRPAAWGAGLLAAGFAALLATGFGQALARWVGTAAAPVEVRLAVYGASLDLWRRFPVVGTGLGTFRDAFPLVQPEELPDTFWHAESDLLELLVTTGVAGVTLLGLGFVALLRSLLRVLAAGEWREDRAAALAALGALAAVALHECVDFGLTMPAVAVTLATVVGAAAGGPLAARSGARGRSVGGGAPGRSSGAAPGEDRRAGDDARTR